MGPRTAKASQEPAYASSHQRRYIAMRASPTPGLGSAAARSSTQHNLFALLRDVLSGWLLSFMARASLPPGPEGVAAGASTRWASSAGLSPPAPAAAPPACTRPSWSLTLSLRGIYDFTWGGLPPLPPPAACSVYARVKCNPTHAKRLPWVPMAGMGWPMLSPALRRWLSESQNEVELMPKPGHLPIRIRIVGDAGRQLGNASACCDFF